MSRRAPGPEHFDEPLALSAPLARRLAPQLCRADPATGESCAWYHGLWQYLRLFNVQQMSERYAAFFRGSFAARADKSRPARVLVSGAADYWMLAQVLAAFRERGAEPAITVIDLCETPLELCRWYAQRVGAKIATSRSDALQYEASEPFDVICTHAFFGRFAPASRARLVAHWRELLRPGGAVVTMNAVRAGDPDKRYPATHAQALGQAVQAEIDKRGGVPPAEAAALVRDAVTYTATHRVYRVASAEEMHELFTRAGLHVERLVTEAPYVGVVATR